MTGRESFDDGNYLHSDTGLGLKCRSRSTGESHWAAQGFQFLQREVAELSFVADDEAIIDNISSKRNAVLSLAASPSFQVD